MRPLSIGVASRRYRYVDSSRNRVPDPAGPQMISILLPDDLAIMLLLLILAAVGAFLDAQFLTVRHFAKAA